MNYLWVLLFFIGGLCAAETCSENDGHNHGAEIKKPTPSTSTCSADDGHNHGDEIKKPTQPTSTCSADDGHDHGAEKTASTKCSGDDEPQIVVTSAQRAAFILEEATAQRGQIASVLRLYGELTPIPERVAKVMPKLPGFVAVIKKKEGDLVKKNEVLAEMQSVKLGEMYSDYHSAKELEELNKSEYERNQKLFANKSIAERELLRSKRDAAEARIHRERAAELLLALGFNPEEKSHAHADDSLTCTHYFLRAPFDGVIIAQDVAVGENFAEDNTRTLFTVADFSQLYLRLNAKQNDLAKITIGQNVEIEIDGKTLNGKVDYLAPFADAVTRMVTVRVAIENSQGLLRPGLFATGIIKTDNATAPIIVERDAVVLLNGENVVFVPEKNGYASRVVMLGDKNKNFAEVLHNLKIGDKYVKKGAFELKAILVNSGVDPHAGHGH